MDRPATNDGAPRRSDRRLAVLALAVGMAVLLQPWLTSIGATPEAQSPAAVPPAVASRPRPAGPLRAEPAVRMEAEPAVRMEAEPAMRMEAAALPRPRPGAPVRLVVPALHVDAPVVPIGAPDGVLLPPSDPRTLGWWRDGARPGAPTGTALITGHTVHTGGGAFDDLETLRRGDAVRVRTRHGELRYVVSTVRIYRKSTLARDAQQLFSQTVPGRLVLITCEDWNGSTYLSNAVVVADPR